jgi:hypothetical protein
VELVEQTRTQAGPRASLAQTFDAIQSNVRQVVFLCDLAVKLRAELELITLVQ